MKSILALVLFSFRAFGITTAVADELDGTTVICELKNDGLVNIKQLMAVFQDDRVDSYFVKYEERRDGSLGFSYITGELIERSNHLSITAEEIFWCDVANIGNQGAAASLCRAEDVSDLVSKALSSHLTGGSFTQIKRKTLDAVFGILLMGQVVYKKTGFCRPVGKKETATYLAEAQDEVKRLALDYSTLLEDARPKTGKHRKLGM